MSRKIQFKRGLETDLPTLAEAELAFTTDSKKTFIGSSSGNVELAKKTELDTTNANVAANTSAITQGSNPYLNFAKYGDITLPSDFNHNLDFKLWRDIDGKVQHNFDFDSRNASYTTYYISDSGSNTNDGLTTGTPKRDIGLLIDQIEADGNVTSAKIKIISSMLTRDSISISGKTLTKNYAIIADTETYVGNFQRGLTWTQYATGVYSASRASVTAVFDSKFKESYGMPSRLTQVTTLADCVATKGSWYTDGTLVYVHRKDESSIDNNQVFVALSVTIWQPTFGANVSFMAKNLTFVNGATSAPIYFSANTSSKGNVILQNIKLTSALGTSANGIATAGVKSIWSFNCLVKDIARDGFNYHNTLDGDTFAFEYNCMAYNCGLNDTNYNNNATTAHEGIRVLRIGTKGWNTSGPLCADVNGCYTINIDCTMHDSNRPSGTTKSAYYFDDSPSSINATPNGKAILINCNGGGLDTYAINGDVSFKLNKITVDNFRGRNIPSDVQINIMA